MHKVILMGEKYLFIPFNIQSDKNIPNAQKVFHDAIINHREMIDNTYCFTLLNVPNEFMNEIKVDNKTMMKHLAEHPSIDSVERTPGTQKSGKWTIISTKARRDAAEQGTDKIITNFTTHRPDQIQNRYKP